MARIKVGLISVPSVILSVNMLLSCVHVDPRDSKPHRLLAHGTHGGNGRKLVSVFSVCAVTSVRKHNLLAEEVRYIIVMITCIKVERMFGKQLRQRNLLERRDADDLEDFVQAWLEFQSFLQYSYEQVGTHRRPDLDTHCVLRVANKAVNTEVLFDPSEEQFDLPACPVQLSDIQGRNGEQIGEENQREILQWVAVADATQCVGVAFLAEAPTQSNSL